ncbi:hypothetical protein NDA18_001415 [Ustilago nuda]|nr:hypothetical protein NDA18_001415 [Ustilago nuda]
MAPPTTATTEPVADLPVDLPADAVQAGKKNKKHRKDKKDKKSKDAVTSDDDADAVADELDDSPESKALRKERKRQKKERKERERLEREQAEKDAATVAAASAAQAVNAVASATRLPIDPCLDSFSAVAPAVQQPPASLGAATHAVTQPTTNHVAALAQPPSAPAAAAGTSTAGEINPATGEQKRKRGRPKKDPNAPSVKKVKKDPSEGGQRRGRRPKMSEEAALEELRGLPPRELLVERVYSSDMLAKLERTIGLKYQKGRFSKQEQDTIKNGIAEFMKLKGLSEEDFQELLYNYREKGWEKMYTELWKDLAGRLDGRPNIAVRLHVRTNKSQFRRQGRYTLAEDHEIKQRMGALREDAASVAKRLGRLNQDVLSRFVKLQVKHEMADGPPWNAEEDKAVLAALDKFKQEHPGEVISWKAIANMMGNKRSYKVYSNLFSNIRSRVDRTGPGPRKDYGTMGDDSNLDPSQQAVRGINRHPTRADLDNSVWIPGEDDLILLQRLNFQDALAQNSVQWDRLSFESWQWPEETLKQQFQQIKSRYLPEPWIGGWQETLDKIIRTIRTRRTKKEIDDEGDDKKGGADVDQEAEAAFDTEADSSASAAIDPALSGSADAPVAEPAAAST